VVVPVLGERVAPSVAGATVGSVLAPVLGALVEVCPAEALGVARPMARAQAVTAAIARSLLKHDFELDIFPSS